MSERIEQSGRLREESPPDDSVVVVRGGRDTIEKLEGHINRTARGWTLDGTPLEGISVFCALDDAGGASLDGVLKAMRSYRFVHLVTAGELRNAGYGLLATGRRPHFTLHDATTGTIDLQNLLAVLGEPQGNPRFEPGRRS